MPSCVSICKLFKKSSQLPLCKYCLCFVCVNIAVTSCHDNNHIKIEIKNYNICCMYPSFCLIVRCLVIVLKVASEQFENAGLLLQWTIHIWNVDSDILFTSFLLQNILTLQSLHQSSLIKFTANMLIPSLWKLLPHLQD